MALGWQQLLIVLVLVLVLFGGRGRISSLMGDMAQGIKSFRTGLKDDGDDAPEAARLQATEAPKAEAVVVEPADETASKTKA